MWPHQTRVAQQQRLDPDHRREGEHLIEQLGVGDRHHDGGLAELCAGPCWQCVDVGPGCAAPCEICG